MSHNPRGLRKLFWRLSHTPKATAIPFFETLLDLLYSLNPEGTWLQAVGMDYLLTDVKIFTLLAGWFHERKEIKEWLLSLATAPLPKRKYRISIAEWFLLPELSARHQKDEPKDELHHSFSLLDPLTSDIHVSGAENDPVQKEVISTPAGTSEAERMIMVSLDGPVAPFQYRKISPTVKRVRFLEGGKKYNT